MMKMRRNYADLCNKGAFQVAPSAWSDDAKDVSHWSSKILGIASRLVHIPAGRASPINGHLHFQSRNGPIRPMESRSKGLSNDRMGASGSANPFANFRPRNQIQASSS
eukprot:scaffold4148_cov240-Pinguiococcus_pyrenoidosus.AAC.8